MIKENNQFRTLLHQLQPTNECFNISSYGRKGSDKKLSVEEDKKHKRTKTQFTFLNKSSRKNTEKEVNKSSTYLISQNSQNSNESTQKKDSDIYSNYFLATNDEYQVNTFLKKSQLEEQKKYLLEVNEQENTPNKNIEIQKSTQKQMFLFYRTPSNKENKNKIIFNDVKENK